MEIQQKFYSSFVAYDLEAFVGNSGGYIGLFLGYALLQIPGMLCYMITWCYKYFLKWMKANVNNENNDETTQEIENISTFQVLPGLTTDSISNPGIVNHLKYLNYLKTLVRQEVQNQLKKDPQEINCNV